MGEVWVAESVEGGEVAVKLAASALPRASCATRRLSEARVLDAVRHPHIVELLGTGCLDEIRPFIVMELLAGRTLGSELAIDGPLSLGAAARRIGHVASALEHIHAIGFVHRDIKPQNLFSCGAGDDAHVKIIDFGLAVPSVDRAPEHRRRLEPRLAGSPAFMNPDDLMGRTLPSAQSDLWALAVTAYVMLTRRLPFRATSHVMWRHPEAWHFGLPSSHRADIPARVDEWFQRAFSRDPAERFQLAADAGREFVDALADRGAASLSLRACLSDEEILAFCTGSMSFPEVQLADAHIGTCPACSDLLSSAVSLTGEEHPSMNAAAKRSLSRVARGP